MEKEKMNNTVLMYALILLLGVFISAISQVMLKKAALKKYDSVIKEYMNPLVIIAYVMFVGTTFLSILAYKGIPLSMGPVLEATSYIYVTIFGVTIFKEKMNKKKIASLALIMVGILVYSVWG
jgi:drug/metabolite transporter (DMT)-like permease